MKTPRQTQATPAQSPCTAANRGSVQDGETLLVDALCRRYGLKKHSRRQLRNRGLRMVRFGSKDFTTGKWFREFLERLAEQQQERESWSCQNE